MRSSIVLSASLLLVCVASSTVKFGREDQTVRVLKVNENGNKNRNDSGNHNLNNNNNNIHDKNKKKEQEKKKQEKAQQQSSTALNSTSIANLGANSSSIIVAANSTVTSNLASNSSLVTAAPVAGVRNRPCDQGDQALAAGMQTMAVIGIGQQASVVTLQGLVGGNQTTFQTGLTRLNQFMSTAALNLQMMGGIADTASLAQPQIALLTTSSADQATLIKTLSLTGGIADNTTLTTLGASFAASTGVSQDGAANAVADCFLPVNAVSG